MFYALNEALVNFTPLSVFIRLILACLCGGMIGFERGIKRRAAGLRTYMLVCLGAALVMITSQFISQTHNTDPARLGAQVISGIGFLGAGTIIVTKSLHVVGLTTAAGLWASACMGLAVGAGFYDGALMGSVLIFIIITVMHRFDNNMLSRSRSMEIYAELTDGGKLSEVFIFARENMIEIINVEIISGKYGEGKTVAASIALRTPKKKSHLEVLELFREQDCLAYVEEI